MLRTPVVPAVLAACVPPPTPPPAARSRRACALFSRPPGRVRAARYTTRTCHWGRVPPPPVVRYRVSVQHVPVTLCVQRRTQWVEETDLQPLPRKSFKHIMSEDGSSSKTYRQLFRAQYPFRNVRQLNRFLERY